MAAAGGKRQVRPLRMLILTRTASISIENALLDVHGLCSVAADGASAAIVRQTFGFAGSHSASRFTAAALPGMLMMWPRATKSLIGQGSRGG